MDKMTLSRALRYKKRVIEMIRRLENDIQVYNSTLAGSEEEVDVRKSLELRKGWVEHLLEVKLKIQEATRPIQRMILELAETKSEIAFLQRVSVVHGKTTTAWEDKPQVWTAVIRKAEKDQLTAALQGKIDKLQTTIDTFNAEHVVEFFPALDQK